MVSQLVSLATAILYATTALAAPISLESRQSSGSCSPDGQVICLTASTFQQCASGFWQSVQSVADGTTCTDIFVGASSGAAPSPSPSATTINKPASLIQENAPPAPPSTIKEPATLLQDSPPVTSPSATSVNMPASLPVESAKPAAVVAQPGTISKCLTTPGQASSFSGPADNFPPQSSWMCFDQLWDLQLPALQVNDSPDVIDALHSAILQVAGESGIDGRVILAVIMQESAGDVYVPTTNNGVVNPGIMQSHDGVSFDPANAASSVLQMVRDGVEGTSSGPGLEQLQAQNGGFYQAMRAYNSGSVDESNLSNGLGSTSSYVSDCANRLIGAKLS